MKKWLLSVLILALLAIVCIYFLIPGKISLAASKPMKLNARGLTRAFMNENNWAKWWPGRVISNGKSFEFNDHTYTIIDKKINAVVVVIAGKKNIDTTTLNILTITRDSVDALWEGSGPNSFMPVSRVQNYFSSKQLNHDLHIILDKLESFYSNEDNMYGIPIRHDKVVDSTLLQNSAVVNTYPDNELIYSLLDQLKEYMAKHRAKQTGTPMLNISTIDSVRYIVKVAIPVDKKLEPSGNIVYKWMLGGGNILVSEIKGGPATINNAFQCMEEYIGDHDRLAPAIPFQSLITDRRAEKDTAKWITRIYYPVM